LTAKKTGNSRHGEINNVTR